jgi:molybdopterin/thiamine biosynthesis adenylyltransferase
LTKGRCEIEYINKVLEILAKNCEPPFEISEIKSKIQSALNREKSREHNLAFEVREWVNATNGDFCATNFDKERQIATKTEKATVRKILERLSKENPPVIEKAGTKNGWWRLIDQECKPEDWVNSDCSYMDLWLPLGLGEICGVQPGNILIFAGAKDSGKTAFLMNIAKENRHRYQVHYFNSEMGKQEFKLRASLFEDISINEWNNFNLYSRSSNFQDVLKKGEGNLNIIDYLEAPEEAYRIGPMIKRIHDRLEGSICVIGLQKKIGQDLGRGAEFSMEKARLYVSLDYQKAKIISCKNFKENEIIKGNPRGYSTKYKLVNGCKIIKSIQGWTILIENKET